MAARKRSKSSGEARLNFRLDNSIKQRVTRAAEISGQTVTDFACAAITREADQVLARYDVIKLAEQDRDFFLSVLDEDRKPSKKSLAAARRYREGRRKGNEYHW